MSWISYHFYYHGDRDLLLRELLRPLAEQWLASGEVELLFLVRYPLGGDHVRFRFLPSPGADRERLGRRAEEAADAFFARRPSLETRPAATIAAEAAIVLASDPNETDAAVYPDNSWRLHEFAPETERYGGPAALSFSFELFTISSLEALLFAARAEPKRSRRLTAALALLAGQAAAFARGEEELGGLLAYAEAWQAPGRFAALAKADEVYAQSAALAPALLEVAEKALPSLSARLGALARGSGGLRRRLELAGCTPERIRLIGASQLHMTANRLGLSNSEEVYLSRLARRCFEDWRSGLGADRFAAIAAAGAAPAFDSQDLQRALEQAIQDFRSSDARVLAADRGPFPNPALNKEFSSPRILEG